MKDEKLWRIKIDPPWIIPIKKDNYFGENGGSLVIGGEVEMHYLDFVKYNFYLSVIRNCWSRSTNYLSCCEVNHQKESRVVRRFHFDASKGDRELFEARSHLHFGGICHEMEAVSRYQGSNLHYCLDNRLDIPRLPYPPIDIIILLDLIVRQFDTVIDRSFVEKREWINLVRNSEDFRLRNYYKSINHYYESKEVKGRLKTLFEKMCEEDFCF